MAAIQEFNGDILVDGNVQSSSATVNGSITATSATISGALVAAFLNGTGSSTNQAMSQAAVTNAINKIYPIGCVYMSTSSTSPAALFGGTWRQITANAYFKIVTSDAGTVGGVSNHTITTANMPSHEHEVRTAGGGTYQNSFVGFSGGSVPGVSPYTAFAVAEASNKWGLSAQLVARPSGGGQPYYPAYYGIYAWEKISN